jgi:hypothetical protein
MTQGKILFLEHEHTVTYNNGSFVPSTPRDTKKLSSGAIVPLSLLNIHTLKLPINLSEDEQAIHVEIRMFEEGNLNSDEEYTIDFIRHTLVSEESYLCEVFALSRSKAADYFSEALKNSSVIDLITPGFLIYESQYDTLPKQNDLFIYLGEEESFGAIYQEGKYIAHRSIDTLAVIAVETGLDLAKLKSFLSQRGVIEESYPPEEFAKFVLIQDRLARNIERLVHTINHKRGPFGLTGIDQVYLDFEGNTIPGLPAVFDAYGMSDLHVTALALPQQSQPEALHNLLSAHHLTQKIGQKTLNLSAFERKALWYKRESGKFLAIFGIALLIALGIPLTIVWMISQEEQRKEELTTTLEQIQKETVALSASLTEQKKLLTARQEEEKSLQEEIALIQGAQETADLIAQMHLKRQQFLIDATQELGHYGLGTLMVEQNGSKEITLHVISKYQKRDDIAKLMSGLYARGYQNAQTHEITLDNKMYNAVVKATR